MRCIAATIVLAALCLGDISASRAETPDEWIALGTRVHGGYGAFIPLGIRIGLDALERLKARPRELTVLYFDSDKTPCACLADGVAVATQASVGQRSLRIAAEAAPEGTAAVIEIRLRQGGQGVRYTIPLASLARLVAMNRELDARGRHEAVMKADALFEIAPAN